MSSRLIRLGTAALLAATGAAAQEVPHFEMDYVFPRNETYSTVDILPVALAVQNLTAVRTIGDFKILWAIMPYRDGVTPTGVTPGMGYFEIPEPRENDDEPYIFVDYTNVTEWIGRKQGPETYAMQFYLQWVSGGKCDDDAGDDFPSLVIGHHMFSIESPTEAKHRAEDRLDPVLDIVDEGQKPDLMDAVGCPIFGTVYEIRPNTGSNSSCPLVVDEEDTGREPNPCGARIDKTVASSIASRATSLAEAAQESRAAEERERNGDGDGDDDEEDAASGGRASLAAVAAAFGLGLMALAL